jgi:hypothetical protein
MFPRIRNHLLRSLLCFTTATNTIPQQGIHIRGYSNLGLAGSPQPQCGGLQSPNGTVTPVVPHFHARRWASLKVIHSDTTSASITKYFLVNRWNTRKHTNVGKSLELRIARVIYRVEQITHRAIIKNKRDQVIVTMNASKLKMNTRTKHIRIRTQSL